MKNLLPVDVDFSKLEARLWAEEKRGVEGGKEDRGEGGCVRCQRRKVPPAQPPWGEGGGEGVQG